MSDIRVSVRWESSAVFAGEEVECTVTFKNVTPPSSLRRSPSPNTKLRSHGSSRERWKETLPSRLLQGTATQGRNVRSQKPLSLKPSHGFPLPRMPNIPRASSRPPDSERNTHRRSVSIISIGGDTASEASSPGPILNPTRPARGHGRAASLQVNARKLGSLNSGSSSGNPDNVYKVCLHANVSVSARTRPSFHCTFSVVSILKLCTRSAGFFASYASLGSGQRPFYPIAIATKAEFLPQFHVSSGTRFRRSHKGIWASPP